jgi:hypothetical protein
VLSIENTGVMLMDIHLSPDLRHADRRYEPVQLRAGILGARRAAIEEQLKPVQLNIQSEKVEEEYE